MTNFDLIKISFPEIKLQTRDAHKLRGYFGSVFKEHSNLLHNHFEDGTFRYEYPDIQYKILAKTPTIIGINEGVKLLSQLFLDIDMIKIDKKNYQINSKDIINVNQEIGYSRQLHEYQFITLWMALNQDNYNRYSQLKTDLSKEQLLNEILIGHILGFFKHTGTRLDKDERLFVKTKAQQKFTNFKQQKMIAFTGSFIVNALLPDFIGLGKSVSRGFGSIKRI